MITDGEKWHYLVVNLCLDKFAKFIKIIERNNI